MADDQLKKVLVRGGPSIVVCDVPSGTRGTSWGTDEAIVFGNAEGLWRVSAAGGIPEQLTTVDGDREEAGHYWPQVLPGSEAVVFVVSFGAGDTAQVTIRSLDTGQQSTLIQGSYPRVTATGELIFSRNRSLWAVRLDRRRLSLVGEPVPVLENLATFLNGLALYDIADDGTLVYQERRGQGDSLQLTWLERNGQAALSPEARSIGYSHPPVRLSPDGTRLAVTTHPEGGDDEIIVYDLERGIRTPLTTGSRMNSRYPVWTPDGSSLTFASQIAGSWDIYSMQAAGRGAPEPLLVREHDQTPASWSPDGNVLAFVETSPAGSDIWILPRDGEPSPLIDSSFAERDPNFSPDGHWLAYVSNESGRIEVWLQSYPEPGTKAQVSTDGGSEPVWSPDGAELFYRQGEEALMAVSLQTTPVLRVGRPTPVLQVNFNDEPGWANYDISPDGRRFVVIHDLDTTPPSFVVVLNWFDELQRLVPAP